MYLAEKGKLGEEFVNEISNSSFLDYWCYPSPKDEYGDKKEICDLLILFGNSIIIISVKNYEFKDSYLRYFRKTIDKAVKQIYGAERKLLSSKRDIFIKHPKREIERFQKENIVNIYRVIVNLGEGVRFYPFNKATKDEKFITLLDKDAFQTIVHELDTIPDFIEYLQKREELFADKIVTILPGDEDDFPVETAKQFNEYVNQNFNPNKKQSIIISGTEHDFLASYLMNNRSFPEFFQSKKNNGLIVQLDGNWTEYNERDQVMKKRDLDKKSYFLDELVKREVISNYNEDSFELAKAILSFNRFNRRIISSIFLDFYYTYKDANENFLARRYTDFDGVGFVFAFYPLEMPQKMVNALLRIALDSFSVYSDYKSKTMILIATTNDFKQFKMGLIKNIIPFPQDHEEQIRKDVELLGWFKNLQEFNVTENEYPEKE
jgi:hypothetical protein